MNNCIDTSLIISTYNYPQALKISLISILNQTKQPSEIIIADDGSKEETRKLINDMSKLFSIPLIHIWHEDKGFRKTIILNKAILRASSPYIIQIDGDIMIGKHFIEDHLRVAEHGCFIRGTRTILNKRTSEILFKTGKISLLTKIKLAITQPGNAIRLCPDLIRFTTRKKLSGEKVKGCNMAFWKKDLLAINGYNNKLNGWGHEDEELSWRLTNLGIQKKIIRYTAICFHMYHPFLSRKDELRHLHTLETIKIKQITVTKFGLDNLK